MILTFKEQFVEKIKSGQKVTTIRKAGRWSEGDKIHFWKGNPRNVKQNPYSFGVGKVVKVETIALIIDKEWKESVLIKTDLFIPEKRYYYHYFQNKKYFNEIANNEGFKDFLEMYNWFKHTYFKKIKKEDGNLYLSNLDLIQFEYLGEE